MRRPGSSLQTRTRARPGPPTRRVPGSTTWRSSRPTSTGCSASRWRRRRWRRSYSNQAQSFQQQASSSSPGNDSTFSGGTLGSLSQDPVSQAQAASETDQQTKALIKAGVLAKRASSWWKKSASTYGKIVVLPAFAQNDLAATVWLNYGSAAQSANDAKSAIKAYDAFLKLAPEDVNAPQVRKIVKQLKTTSTTSTQ